ncbi:S8 family peptidase [Patiriisocius sp. Uisw_017]|jgi:subtilisin family serine protease|uniref:S8 family peptidase n=1 Tax=Patiriisocius sp. Uisw_017 TaxID=3230968 RepID=UPI0039E9CC80
MKKLLLLTCLSFFLCGNAQSQARFVENEILVQLDANITASRVTEALSNIQVIESELISKPLNIWLLRLAPLEISEAEVISELYKNAFVQVAQKNHIVTTRATTPDDTLFDDQWQYFQSNDRDIDADDAWDVSTGGFTMNGDEIVAAVLDDGHDLDHEDFGDNLWTNEAEIPDNDIDDDGNTYIDDYLGWSIVTNDDNISGGGHGTPVAGIVGAQGNNGIGVTGVNWDVKVMIIKNNFSTNEARVIQAYSYVLEARILYNETDGAEGAFVVSTNASWGVDFGNPDDAPLWCGLYDTLGENGILSCGATINANQNVDIIGDLPTACPSEYLIAVTNTNILDNKVTSAGYGAETIDLGAPGAGTITPQSGNGYGGFGGTSAATPHVTGTIALLYSAPCQNFANLAKTNPAVAARLVRDYIFEGVDPNASLEGITTTGGRLNVNNAIQALMAGCESLSVEGFNSNQNVNLYPNPSNGIITITTNDNSKLKSVIIYAVDGRKVKEINDFQNTSVSISDLARGSYIFKISFEGNIDSYNKIVIKE